MKKTILEFIGQVCAIALFFVAIWVVLGIDGALSGDNDMLTESFKSAMRALFGR